mmetsp:Transcript_35112/g.105612  ORF Transcript_35112/g.105612 Transcript_35112/m.105612 type:complete len:220 (-) Transcript_35112:1830-2489(-)
MHHMGRSKSTESTHAHTPPRATAEAGTQAGATWHRDKTERASQVTCCLSRVEHGVGLQERACSMSTPCTGSRQGAGTRGAGPPGKAREGRGRGNRPASNRPAGRSGRRNRRRRGSVRQPAGDRGVVGAVIEAQRPTGATRPPVRRGVSRKCLGSVEAAPVPAPSPGGRARAAREGARRRRRRGWRRGGGRKASRRRRAETAPCRGCFGGWPPQASGPRR